VKPFIFKHFAANGRTVTACGLRIEPNKNEKQHSNGYSSWTHASGEPTTKLSNLADAASRELEAIETDEHNLPSDWFES
jgi:hypothetical protein